jgi:CRISPR/Cas system-associated endoribonuclease Cas2
MSKISSSPIAGLVPGSSCVPTPSPSLPTIPTLPTPIPTPLPPFPPGGGIGGLKDAINQRNSSQVANAQANQLEQIQRGVQNGTISTQEATKLLEQQAKIAESVKAAQADGFMSSSERANIQRQQMMAGFGVAQASSSMELGNLLSRDNHLSQRQAEQIGSIAQGVRSGSLTGGEASSLLQGQANISRSLANAQADGHVSLGEMVNTYFQQEGAGQNIQREKGDLEKSPHARGGLRELINQKRSAEVANAQAGQLEQIQRGVQNGTISQQEATKLLEQQAKIAESIKAAQADGSISDSERANIRRQQMMAGFGVSQAANSYEFDHLFSRDSNLSQRQAEQIGSIAQGIRSGSLTGGEASSLLTGQADIARSLDQAQADGHVNFGEMVNTYFKQESAGQKIDSEKGDLEKAAHARRRLPIFF